MCLQPFTEFTEQFKSVKEFNFDSLCTKQLSGVSKTIILGAPLQSEEHLNDQLVRIKLILEKIQPTDEILLKPHYSSKPELLNAMKRQWRKEGVKCELLNDNRPIESVISRYNCDAVYAIHPTSALINLSLMFGPSVQFYFYREHWLNERLSQVFSRLEITALDENQLTETLKLL